MLSHELESGDEKSCSTGEVERTPVDLIGRGCVVWAKSPRDGCSFRFSMMESDKSEDE